MTPSNTPPSAGHHRPTGETADDPYALSGLVAAGRLDVVTGDPLVPITVIRIADADSQYLRHRRMPPSLLALLLGLYTRPGDTVLDFATAADPVLAGVCGAGARRYLAAADTRRVPTAPATGGQAGLIILRWPDDVADLDETPTTTLLHHCAHALTDNGKLIVAVLGDLSSDIYIHNAADLIPIAHRAGLGYFQHLVAVRAPIAGEHITRRATPADAATLRAATHIQLHHSILIFTGRSRKGGRRG
jgi:hypothetical protein